MEAGIEARYQPRTYLEEEGLDDDSDFLGGVVEGRRAGAGAGERRAADRKRGGAAIHRRSEAEGGLAPPPGDPDRYRLQEWLSFIGTEIHKAFLFPTFWYKDDALARQARVQGSRRLVGAVRASRGPRIPRRRTASPSRMPTSPGRCCCSVPPASTSRNGHALSAYLARMQARPTVRDAIATEMALRKTVAASPA